MRRSIFRTSALRLSCVPIMLLLLTSCAASMQNRVSPRLNAARLNSLFYTKPIDLSIGNNCQPPLRLTVVNKEDKNMLYKADAYHLYSNELCGSISKYIEEKLIESRVHIDAVSGKQIHASIEHLEMGFDFVWSALLIIKITIPDINYSRLYESRQRSGRVYNALAYAVHLTTVQFLSDPVVQSYITCTTNSKIVQGGNDIISEPFRLNRNRIRPITDKDKTSLAAAHLPISKELSKKDPNVIYEAVLDRAYHVGDDYVSRFDRPHAQGFTYEHIFDISELRTGPFYIDVWVSDMVPNCHKRFLEGDYQNRLMINNRNICVLNDYVSGTADKKQIVRVTVPVGRHVLRKGRNVIKIIAGERPTSNYNKDDFQIHRIIIKYQFCPVSQS